MLNWVFVTAAGLSRVVVHGGYSLNKCSVWASHCSGFCWCEAWALAAQASVLGARGLTSCSSWALDIGSTAVAHRLTCSEACGIFLEWARTHVPCLVGRCFTTEPPGQPLQFKTFKMPRYHILRVVCPEPYQRILLYESLYVKLSFTLHT